MAETPEEKLRQMAEARAMVKAKSFVQMLLDVKDDEIERLTLMVSELQQLNQGGTQMPKIAWSWSRIECFEQCPHKFHHKNILKDVPFVSNAALEKGKRVHKDLEDAGISSEQDDMSEDITDKIVSSFDKVIYLEDVKLEDYIKGIIGDLGSDDINMQITGR